MSSEQFELLTHNHYFRRKERTLSEDEIQECECEVEDGQACTDDSCLNRSLQMECMIGWCSAGDACCNQRLQRQQFPSVERFRAGKKGYGLRLLEPVKAGTMIGEYLGEIIDAKEFENRMAQYQTYNHWYLMTLGAGEYIDACQKGGMARFINHSCNPNCETQLWQVGAEKHVAIFTLKDLEPGTELTFDYQWQRIGFRKWKCYCGSTNCTGFIGSGEDEEGTLPPGDFRDPKARERRADAEGGMCLVGRYVQIWREDGEYSAFHAARVTEYDGDTDRHTIQYVLGATQAAVHLHSPDTKWKILEPTVRIDTGVGSFLVIPKRSVAEEPPTPARPASVAGSDAVGNHQSPLAAATAFSSPLYHQDVRSPTEFKSDGPWYGGSLPRPRFSSPGPSSNSAAAGAEPAASPPIPTKLVWPRRRDVSQDQKSTGLFYPFDELSWVFDTADVRTLSDDDHDQRIQLVKLVTELSNSRALSGATSSACTSVASIAQLAVQRLWAKFPIAAASVLPVAAACVLLAAKSIKQAVRVSELAAAVARLPAGLAVTSHSDQMASLILSTEQKVLTGLCFDCTLPQPASMLKAIAKHIFQANVMLGSSSSAEIMRLAELMLLKSLAAANVVWVHCSLLATQFAALMIVSFQSLPAAVQQDVSGWRTWFRGMPATLHEDAKLALQALQPLHRLTPAQLAILSEWVAAGDATAPFDDSPAAGGRTSKLKAAARLAAGAPAARMDDGDIAMDGKADGADSGGRVISAADANLTPRESSKFIVRSPLGSQWSVAYDTEYQQYVLLRRWPEKGSSSREQGFALRALSELHLYRSLAHAAARRSAQGTGANSTLSHLLKPVEIVVGPDWLPSKLMTTPGVSPAADNSLPHVYLVFPYVPHDVAGILEGMRHGYCQATKLSVEQCRSYAHQLLEIVAFCHQQRIILRSLNSSMLSVDYHGTLQVSGLGSANRFEPKSLYHRIIAISGKGNRDTSALLKVEAGESSGQLSGSALHFVAPELLRGAALHSTQSDCWSVGCCIAHMYLGAPLVAADNVTKQLDYIFRLCGTPDSSWPAGLKLPNISESLPKQSCKNRVAKELVSRGVPEADADMIAMLLRVDPGQRASLIAVLGHGCFQDFPEASIPPPYSEQPSLRRALLPHVEAKRARQHNGASSSSSHHDSRKKHRSHT